MTNKKVWWNRIGAGTLLAIAMSLTTANVPAQETNRKVISNPTPNYPELARKVHLAGVVKVQVVIATDGKIKTVRVIGGHPLLVDAVQETLRSWKYAPANSETTTNLAFNFHE
jgi:TonB family protein